MKFLNEEGLRRVVSWIKGNYIDKVSGNNATLSFYKGDKKQDITIDNVANAIKALQDKNGLQIDTNYLKLAGGSMQGLLELFAGSTVPTPTAKDKSTKVVNSEWVQTWVQSFVSELSTNLQVETQEDGHFSCPTLGVSGLMAQNGYICLGKLFGGLILQWGRINSGRHYFPIGFVSVFTVVAVPLDGSPNEVTVRGLKNDSFIAENWSSSHESNKNSYIAIGY